MTSLQQNIKNFKIDMSHKAPADVLALMQRCTDELRASGIENKALGVGQQIPSFRLPDQHGRMHELNEYLKKGPLVINIYRGGWCPYCNMEMKALADTVESIRALGAELIGMSPETPEKAEVSSVQNNLKIDILSDKGNAYSKELGIVFVVPEVLRPIYSQFGIDIPAYNGDDTFTLPLPATYIVRQDGVIHYAFINADYTERQEPADLIGQLKKL